MNVIMVIVYIFLPILAIYYNNCDWDIPWYLDIAIQMLHIVTFIFASSSLLSAHHYIAYILYCIFTGICIGHMVYMFINYMDDTDEIDDDDNNDDKEER